MIDIIKSISQTQNNIKKHPVLVSYIKYFYKENVKNENYLVIMQLLIYFLNLENLEAISEKKNKENQTTNKTNKKNKFETDVTNKITKNDFLNFSWFFLDIIIKSLTLNLTEFKTEEVSHEFITKETGWDFPKKKIEKEEDKEKIDNLKPGKLYFFNI
jgi:hypothetical protein